MNTTHERKDRPSASQLQRLALCPGAFNASLGLTSESSVVAERGMRIHAWLAARLGKGECPALASSETVIADECWQLAQDTIAIWRSDAGIPAAENVESVSEERLWFQSPSLGPLWSGKPDWLLVAKSRALIIDFKTGSNAAVLAKANLQLRALAVLARHVYGVTQVRVAIIQPLVSPQVSMADYNEDDLSESERELNGVVMRAIQADAPKVAGVIQCEYCPAAPSCSERESFVRSRLPTKVVGSLPPSIQWRPEHWKAFLDARAILKNWIEEREEEARRMLRDNPDSVPGYKIEQRSRRKVSDVLSVWERASKHGVTAQSFGSKCTISMQAIRTLLGEVTGKRGKQLDSLTNDVIGEAVTVYTVDMLTKSDS